jgi:hypothetical protein
VILATFFNSNGRAEMSKWSARVLNAITFVGLISAAQAEVVSIQASSAITADWTRTITDAPYYATCNGNADDTAAFRYFNRDAQAQSSLGKSVLMIIPRGKTCMIKSGFTSIGVGVKNFTMYAYGASISDGGTGSIAFGGEGQHGGGHGNNGSVRLSATAKAGDSCVSLPTASPAITISKIVTTGNTWRLTVSDSTGLADGQIVRISDVTARDKGTLEGLQFITVVSSGAPGTIDVQAPSRFLPSFSYGRGGKINDYAGLFTVGQWVLIGGLDTQSSYRSGGYGEPSNPAFYEYVKISNIDLSTGQICFTTPLTYTYKATWPNYDVGGNLGPDPGGGATLWSLAASWDTEYRIYGLNVASPKGQHRWRGRSFYLQDVTSTGANGLFPSMAANSLVVASSWPSANFEIDKINGPFSCTGCSFNIFQTQSRSSSTNLTLRNTTLNQLNGTPWRATLTNVTVKKKIQVGPAGYGTADSFTASGMTTPIFEYTGATATGAGIGINNLAGYSMSGDTITTPMSPVAQPWAVEGSYICFYGATQRACEDIAKVIDVGQSGTNVTIKLNKSYAGSTWPATSGGKVNIRVHPSPAFTCTSCSSADGILAGVAGAPAAAPLFSYWSKAYSGTLGSTVQPPFQLWGKITLISMNVTNAAGSAATFRLSQFDNWPVLTPGFAASNWNSRSGGPRVNAAIAGNRTIKFAGTYASAGTQPGDSGLTMPDNAYVWLGGGSSSGPGYVAVPLGCPGASCPSVTVTMQTDQDIR